MIPSDFFTKYYWKLQVLLFLWSVMEEGPHMDSVGLCARTSAVEYTFKWPGKGEWESVLMTQNILE